MSYRSKRRKKKTNHLQVPLAKGEIWIKWMYSLKWNVTEWTKRIVKYWRMCISDNIFFSASFSYSRWLLCWQINIGSNAAQKKDWNKAKPKWHLPAGIKAETKKREKSLWHVQTKWEIKERWDDRKKMIEIYRWRKRNVQWWPVNVFHEFIMKHQYHAEKMPKTIDHFYRQEKKGELGRDERWK